MGDGRKSGRALYGDSAAVMPEHRTQDDNEKSPSVDGHNLSFPMPPMAPFPLHRELSTGARTPALAKPSPSPTLGRKGSLKTPERAYAKLGYAGRSPITNETSPIRGSASAPAMPKRKVTLKEVEVDNEVAYGHSPGDYH